MTSRKGENYWIDVRDVIFANNNKTKAVQFCLPTQYHVSTNIQRQLGQYEKKPGQYGKTKPI